MPKGAYDRTIRGSVAADGTFRCDACMTRRPAGDRHQSGFCHGCINRGRTYWLRKLGLAGALALARELWGEERLPRAA